MTPEEFSKKRLSLWAEIEKTRKEIRDLERKYALEKLHQAGYKLNQTVEVDGCKCVIKKVRVEHTYPYAELHEIHKGVIDVSPNIWLSDRFSYDLYNNKDK